MKNIIKLMYVIILISLLTGCNKNDNKLQSNQIEYENKILTYDTADIDDVFFTDGINLQINKENKVRKIELTNKNVKTYNDISVGDKIEKVQSSYNHECKIGENSFYVMIDNNKEIPTDTKTTSDNTIIISYYYDNDIIANICVYDNKFATEFR